MSSLLAVVVAALVIPLLGPAAIASPAPASAPSAAECRRTLPSYPEIEPGTTSTAVRTLQCVLNDTQFGPVTVDGYYGPETKAAIKAFTDNFECCIENRFLVRTWYWTILFSQSHRLRGLELGDSGIRVKTLQRALRADGETSSWTAASGRRPRHGWSVPDQVRHQGDRARQRPDVVLLLPRRLQRLTGRGLRSGTKRS